jgi:hypothetical protein
MSQYSFGLSSDVPPKLILRKKVKAGFTYHELYSSYPAIRFLKRFEITCSNEILIKNLTYRVNKPKNVIWVTNLEAQLLFSL